VVRHHRERVLLLDRCVAHIDVAHIRSDQQNTVNHTQPALEVVLL